MITVLARALGRPRSALAIVSGQTARIKTIEVDGLDEPEAMALLIG